ncbi:PadR family transcriptional regulator [Paractinoplanes deccanensis]|uniref:PadR family transcriptional regulator n=1 Tax=Paractinoplanes deccanensis TaxID=113561 RepID=A0ABQ3Y0Z4_9ACTN|nr:PadR family transcriptional regulator [Actinoplanes deccanensis]GID73530.1 PadR family transcriptional regulator [Actinoplanes deccanensis]
MSLRHAVLAALSHGEASGYELAKRFDVSVADFWSATPQQLYRDLEKLERDGLVEARVVEQQRRPNKRVFTLTEDGRAALRDFVEAPARPAAIRDEFLVKLQAVDAAADPGALAATAEARLRRSRDKLARYEQLRDRLLAGRAEDDFLRHGDPVGPYLTLLAGILYEEQNIRWTTLVLRRLAERREA